MESITQSDLIILLKAVFQMANVDASFDEREKRFFNRIIDKGNIDPKMIDEFVVPHQNNIQALTHKLSSKKAKRAFLLTLATMALADQVVEPSEKKMLDELTKSMNVGQLKMKGLTFEDCEAMVLKLVSSADSPDAKEKEKQDEKFKSGQLSDIDLLTR